MRVVLFGDSIVGHWLLPGFVNRGVSWQTTAQMLDRFASDVLAERPDAVLILGGTNDVRARWCFPRRVAGRILEMARMAVEAGVHPIVGTVPPQAQEYLARIEAVNAVLRGSGFDLADFQAALRDNTGVMRADFSEDGVHPSEAGYAVMERVLSDVLRSQEQPSLR